MLSVLCFVCQWPCHLLIVGIFEQPNLKISTVNQILLLGHDYGPGDHNASTKLGHGVGNFTEVQRGCVHLNTVYCKLQ